MAERSTDRNVSPAQRGSRPGGGAARGGLDSGPAVFDSYARLSWNPTTRELEKIETQHEDNLATIERHGAVLGICLDDGLSAWKRGVRRPDFERLLERAGARVSQGIAVWHVDRLFRQPRDLERLIDLADSGFRVVSSHGTRDLSDPDDRFILRIEVAHAARSSDDTSRRVKRRNVTTRELGRSTGGRPGFGFARRDRQWRPAPGQSEDDRPVVSAEQVAAERQALRDAVTDLVAGVASQAAVAERWNSAGLVTNEGNPWSNVTVRNTLLRPVLAGRIEFEGELISRLPGEPIIAEDKWLRLRAIIEGRRRGAPVSNRYLGSGIIRCGICGTPLASQFVDDRGVGRYYCNKQRRGCGRMYIDMHGTDVELRALTIARLSDSRYAQAISTARAQVSERLSELDAEISEIEELQAALSERLGRREIKLKNFDESYAFLQADLDPLLAERESLSGGSPEGPSEALTGAEVARQWDAADVAEKRAMLKSAVGSDHVRILPAIRGHRFNRLRVVLVPADEPFVPLPPTTANGGAGAFGRRGKP